MIRKLGLLLLALMGMAHAGLAAARPDAAASGAGALPVEFEANLGQHAEAVRYLARAGGYHLYLTQSAAVFVLPPRGGVRAPHGDAAAVTMRFLGAQSATLEEQAPTGHLTNYLYGAPGAAQEHGARQVRDIPNFRAVRYRGVYPGVDAVYYGKGNQVEYDLELQPAADVEAITLAFEGARRLELDASGDLLIHTAEGVLRQHRPVVFQAREGRREPLDASYRLLPGGRVGFVVAGRDPTAPLTIDPVLSYSTYLGGSSAEDIKGIAVDASGNAYVAGTTWSSNFPAVNAYRTSLSGTCDVFVAKLNPQGSALVYSTYIGGRRGCSSATAIAVDAAGSAYVTGATSSANYPVTSGAYATSGGAFLTKLAPAGNALTYSTYLPSVTPTAVRVDAAGNAVVAGRISGATLPTTAGAFQTVDPSGGAGSGFVMKFNTGATALLYATYLGGSAAAGINGLALDAAGNAYVTGSTSSSDFPVTAGAYATVRAGASDAFVSKLNATGSALVYSTYLGGASSDYGRAIAVDAAGRAYVTGDTYSVNFPVVSGRAKPYNSTAYSVAFVSVVAADGASLPMSTHFGGQGCVGAPGVTCSGIEFDSWSDVASSIAVDASGNSIHVAGTLRSYTVDALAEPLQAVLAGSSDGFVLRLERDPFGLAPNQYAVRYATRLGGSGADAIHALATDAKGQAYVAGVSGADANGAYPANLPTTVGAYRVASAGLDEAFIAKLSTLGAAVTLTGGCGDWRGGTVQLRAMTAQDATGGVTFYDGASALGSIALAGGMASYSGAAGVGPHRFTAVRDSDQAASAPLYCKVDQP